MAVWQIVIWAYVGAFGTYCLIVFACASIRRARESSAGPPLTVGIVIPAYNEIVHVGCIQATLAKAFAMRAPIVVVDDGSNDGSGPILEDICRETNALLIRHPTNRGKAAALNTGVAALLTDVILTLDADTVIEADDVSAAMVPFSSASIGAVALTVDGTGGSMIARAQRVEYRYVLNFERSALARLGIVFTVPGSASLWRRTALADIGGFRSRTCAEDTDATISLTLAGWRIAVVPTVRAITDCPASIAGLLRQRSRWIWGTIQAATLAFAYLASSKPSHRRAAAVIFVIVTVLNIIGFILAVGGAWRVVSMAADWSDAIAGSALVIVTLIRLGLAHRMEQPIGENILQILYLLTIVQFVNAAAFWYGLLTGRATKMTW